MREEKIPPGMLKVLLGEKNPLGLGRFLTGKAGSFSFPLVGIAIHGNGHFCRVFYNRNSPVIEGAAFLDVSSGARGDFAGKVVY